MNSGSEYDVEYVSISTVEPSPENDAVYGEVTLDDQMERLIESINKRGLEEPIIVSRDGFIISGHRRFFACCLLEMYMIPIRRKDFTRESMLADWAKLLTEYNPQRVKTTATLLREAMLRFSDTDANDAIAEHNEASITVDADFMQVDGTKFVPDVSEKKRSFLAAAQKVIEGMREFWPLSVRQIHYQLLNNPPLTSEPKRSKKAPEHYRYRNDKASYDALIELLRQARYNGHVAMSAIDDPTRPHYAKDGWDSAADFIEYEVSGFLCGYDKKRQLDQPRYIEVLGEKNTIAGIIKPITDEYYVPLTLARGYGSIPVWRDMSQRFRKSCKSAMTLIIASDYDPEGFDLADDAIRSLRDLFGVDLDYHRVAVNREQIDELGLSSDFNEAKATSSRLKSFIERTGGKETWELESLPPKYLRDQIRAAIEANMDMGIYQQTIKSEQDDAKYIRQARNEIALSLEL